MKKLIIISVLFILYLIACHSQQKISYVFNKSYTQTEVTSLESDFKEQLQKYEISTTNIENWNRVQFDTDSGYISQRFLTKQVDEKTIYVFIYSSIVEKSSIHYTFSIRKEEK